MTHPSVNMLPAGTIKPLAPSSSVTLSMTVPAPCDVSALRHVLFRDHRVLHVDGIVVTPDEDE